MITFLEFLAESKPPKIKKRPEYEGKNKHKGKFISVLSASNSGGDVVLNVEVHNSRNGDPVPSTEKIPLKDFIQSIK